MCRSASRMRCRITCFAVWAAIRPKFVRGDVAGRDLVLVGGQELRVELWLLGLAELARLRVDRLLLLLDRLRHQLLLQLGRQDQLEDAEVGGLAVEVDARVPGRPRRLLVRRQQCVLERRHQRLGIDPLLLLEAPDGLDDLAAHRAPSSGIEWSGTRFERRMRASGISTSPMPASQTDAALVRGRQRAGEAALALDRLASANPDPAAHEAAEVLGLGQRAIGPRRGDLERPCLEQVAELVGDPLAERQVDPIRMVDVKPQRLGGRALERDQLDLGIEVPKPASRSALEARPSSSLSCLVVAPRPDRRRKKGGPGPTSDRVRVRKKVDLSIASRPAHRASLRDARGAGCEPPFDAWSQPPASASRARR